MIERHGGDVAMICNRATPGKGQTPLDYAVSVGHLSTAAFLITRGADPTLFQGNPEHPPLKFNGLQTCLNPPSVRALEFLL